MPATPIRRRAIRALGLAAISLLVLGGCTTGQKAASNYAGAEDNFLEGCTQIAEQDNTDPGKADPDAEQEKLVEIASPEDYCQCVFDELSGKNGIPYSEFKKINSTMQDEGGPLPDDFIEAYSSCEPGATGES